MISIPTRFNSRVNASLHPKTVNKDLRRNVARPCISEEPLCASMLFDFRDALASPKTDATLRPCPRPQQTTDERE